MEEEVVSNTLYKCGNCKHYRASYCQKYDEVTREEDIVKCIGFDKRDTETDNNINDETL